MEKFSLIFSFVLFSLLANGGNCRGKFIELSWLTAEKKQVVNFSVLKDVFLHPKVKNRTLSIVTVTGPAQSGKTYLLNQCMDHLYQEV